MATTVNNTMVKIQTVTVGSGGIAAIEFNPISAGNYTDLKVVLSGRSTASGSGTGGVWDNISLTFNSSGTGYSCRWLIDADGSASSSNSSSGIFFWTDYSGATTSTFGNTEIYIPNAFGSNYKSVSIDGVMENNGTSIVIGLTSGLWSNTAAITSIKLTPNSGNFAQYSSATLYGITATPNTTKASGGIIYQDATYMYHVFPYSSTFTPSTSLSCDVLIAAGGGGGGYGAAGGGGAGGFRVLTSQSLTATNYTVTVGAGGSGGTSGADAAKGSNSVFGSLTATGGGKGGQSPNTPGTGGSGGGGYDASQTGGAGNEGSYSPVEGYAGGNGRTGSGSAGSGNPYASGGGGGSGAVGANATSSGSGAGGAGSSSYSSWAIATNTGQIVSGTGYYAGGGGGGADALRLSGSGGAGGVGGGGAGGSTGSQAGTAGTVNTGGGGGGGANNSAANGGAGGSGIVIVRYAK